jgi:hypothetical protein
VEGIEKEIGSLRKLKGIEKDWELDGGEGGRRSWEKRDTCRSSEKVDRYWVQEVEEAGA